MPDADTDLKRPFDFVPLPYDTSIDRKAPTGHHVFDGHSGELSCTLTALSPILVMDSENRAGPSRGEIGTFMSAADGSYIIPGTSLKGAIRSVFEALTPCCVSMGSTRHIERSVYPCDNRRSLCPACRAFGFLSSGTVHRGQVNIGQATARPDAQRMREVQLIPMFGPNPGSDHYQEKSPNGGRRAKGRKFYFHQESIQTATTENDRNRGPYVAPLDAGATFDFTVTYENLSETELSTLVSALVLTDDGPRGPVRHKLGYGKPAGLGSARIEITKATVTDNTKDRYRSFDASPTHLTGAERDAWIDEQRVPIFGSPGKAVQKLTEILAYPPDESVRYTYYINGRDF